MMKRLIWTVMAVVVMAAVTANAGVIYSEDFIGTADDINGSAPDVSQTGEAWVAAPLFKQDGSVVPGAGSTTLAFTPKDGRRYTLDGSLRAVTGNAYWLALGFADGQSDTSDTYSRFTADGGVNNKVVGRAWMLFRGDISTYLNKTHYDGTGNAADWTALTALSTDVDMRVVLDTTAGIGAWTAAWYAKAPADSDYSQVGGPTVLPEMTITSVGLASANNQVTGTVESLSLRDDDITVIYPKDGAYISPSPATVSIQWQNTQLEPDDPNTPYVDVWFGTDPNKLSGSYAKVVDAGADTTTYLAQNLPVGTYYWQVDYYSGNPAVTGASPVEGTARSFIVTDDAPIQSVDAGPDMLTWDGKPVQLNSTITDDGISALTYSWTASLPNGLEAAFTPSADIADPSVTITKVPYTNANVANPSFEENVLADGDQTDDGIASGWTISGFGGLMNPDSSTYGGIVPDGENVLWLNNGVNASTVLTETIQAGATYTLSVAVGRNLNFGQDAAYSVQLLAGSGVDAVVVAEDPNTLTVPLDTFETSIVTYTNANPEVVDLPLQIKLACTSTDVPDSDIQFDNVVLTSDPLIPAPTGVSTAGLTLTVQDAANPAVSDSTAIDVYSDACDMTVNGLGIPTAQTDHNADCVTDLKDFVVIASVWLDDYAENGPIEK